MAEARMSALHARLGERMMIDTTRGYALCTAPRSGSNLLGQLLASTKVLGRPEEYFNGPGRRALGLPDYPDEPEAQIDQILTIGKTPNGVYGLKIFASQFDAVSEVRWAERLPNLHFVHLERQDLLGQALSWARARRTKQYRSTQPAKRTPLYDRRLIHDCLVAIVREQARWRLHFARNAIAPLRLSYEEILGAPDAAVNAVADLIGVARPAPKLHLVDLVVQRDALTDAWRERFLLETRDLTELEAL